MWESNPPRTLLTPHTGFEDQEAPQHPSTPIYPLFSLYIDYNIGHTLVQYPIQNFPVPFL